MAICFLHLTGIAQPWNQLRIEAYHANDGLSENVITCLTQDRRGFLWAGTIDGLNRFDGANFNIYRQKHREKNTLPDNHIISVVSDDGDGLWVLETGHIIHFFPDREEIVDYDVWEEDGKITEMRGNGGQLFYDARHTLCLACHSGIAFLDSKRDVFVLHKIRMLSDESQNSAIIDYYQENSNTLLLLAKEGVVQYNVLDHTYAYMDITKRYFAEHNKIQVSCLFKNADGKIWVGTWGWGLLIFDEKTNVTESHLIDEHIVDRGIQNIILRLSKPTNGIFKDEVIIGTARNGVFRVSANDQQKFPGFKALDSSDNLPDVKIMESMKTCTTVFVDHDGNTFVGTYDGLYAICPENQIFIEHRNEMNGVITGAIKRKSADGPFQYFISTSYGGGLYVTDMDFHTIQSFDHVAPHLNLPSNANLNSVYLDNRNDVWVSTMNGLFVYNEGNNQFKSFLPEQKKTNAIHSSKVNSVFQDHQGIFWLSLIGGPPQCYDSEKDLFFDPINDTLLKNEIEGTIIEDHNFNIWIPINEGILRLDEKRQFIKRYRVDPNNENALSHPSINCSFLSSDGKLWFGTDNGLNMYDPKTDGFVKYFREDGLGADWIESIAQDNLGYIWTSHRNAVSVLNPSTGKILVFPDLLCGAMFCHDNEMILSSPGGGIDFYTFNAGLIHRYRTKPIPAITNLFISGDQVNVRNVRVENQSSIELHYQENFLRLDFTGLNLANAKKNRYRCKLEGLESEWTELGQLTSVTYAALRPGEYRFLVICGNDEGEWNAEPATFLIRIFPPFWKTWWFLSLMALLLILFLSWMYWRQIQKLRREEGIKTKLAQLETQAVTAQMNPHFIFNSLNSIQACIIRNDNDAAYKYLNKFAKLVRSILQNSRTQFILLSEELDVLENYLQLEQLRFKDLQFEFHLDDRIKVNQYKVPSSMMQPFIENAIIHGLAHKTGEKKIKIILRLEDDNLEFIVTDNGIGREKAHEINQGRTVSHTSLGTSLIVSRLDLINQQYHVQATFKIRDLYHEDGTARGTEVKICLPKKLQEELF